MRKFAEAHEHVTDIHPAQHGGVEPLFVPVIEPLQLVGPHVGHLVAFPVNDPEVHKGLGPGLDQGEHAIEIFFVLELVKLVGIGQGIQLGHPFVQKKIDGAAPVFRQGLQALHDLGGVGDAELVVDGQAQGKEGDQGEAESCGDDLPLQPTVSFFFHACPPCLERRRGPYAGFLYGFRDNVYSGKNREPLH